MAESYYQWLEEGLTRHRAICEVEKQFKVSERTIEISIAVYDVALEENNCVMRSILDEESAKSEQLFAVKSLCS